MPKNKPLRRHTEGTHENLKTRIIGSPDRMQNEPSILFPQAEFARVFLGPEQLQRMLIYFSKQRPTDPHAQYGFTDVIVRLIKDPLNIVFGQHGVYLFSNYLLVYPYNELDERQTGYITHFISAHVKNLTDTVKTPTGTVKNPADANEPLVPSMNLDARVSKQMGGGYTVRPVQLSNIRLDTLDVLYALVRGIMCGSQKHTSKYRQHAVNLQLQRILPKVVVSRSQLQAVNTEIERCTGLD